MPQRQGRRSAGDAEQTRRGNGRGVQAPGRAPALRPSTLPSVGAVPGTTQGGEFWGMPCGVRVTGVPLVGQAALSQEEEYVLGPLQRRLPPGPEAPSLSRYISKRTTTSPGLLWLGHLLPAVGRAGAGGPGVTGHTRVDGGEEGEPRCSAVPGGREPRESPGEATLRVSKEVQARWAARLPVSQSTPGGQSLPSLSRVLFQHLSSYQGPEGTTGYAFLSLHLC